MYFLKPINMKPRKYSALWYNSRNELKCVDTDTRELAEKKAILNNGTLFVNTRYDAEIRLRRIYLRLQADNRLPLEIDYPYLIK
jgi:hypothetical protein